MSETVHIIIPAINFDNDVSRCLKEINKISSIDFFVTVVFDRFKKIQKPKYKYKLNFISVLKFIWYAKKLLFGRESGY